MRVRDLMTLQPVTVSPTTTLQEVLELMVRHEIRGIPVVDDERVVGIVTDRDVKMMLGPGAKSIDEDILDDDILERDVTWAMTPEVETVDSDALLSIAGGMLLDLRVGALPVVDARGDLIGIISQTDLLGEAVRRFRADEGQ
jgi:acetoin utilization protein AcuB